jgi:methionyl-tRNA formyltransferase
VDGEALKIWRAAVLPGEAGPVPGTRLDVGKGRLALACGEAALELLEVQAAGGRRLAVAEYLRGQGGS